MAENFRSDEKAIAFDFFQVLFFVKCSLIAIIVAFVSREFSANAFMISSISSFVCFSTGVKSTTCIRPSVKVPVLSKQITSTLANVSMQYNCCTNTLYFESLITLTAMTELVSNTNPSGIIPIKEATVPNIACGTFPSVAFT